MQSPKGWPDGRLPLQRDQRFVTVGLSSVQLLGPQTKRRALLIGAPIPPINSANGDGDFEQGTNTATTGVKCTFTTTAPNNSILTFASMFETTGTTVVAALQLVRASVTLNLLNATQKGTFTGAILLQPGDTVQWNVTTAVAASVTDFYISVQTVQNGPRVTLSFIGPAVAEQGLTLGQGTLPLYLHEDWIGTAIRESVQAISNQAGTIVPVLDIFDG